MVIKCARCGTEFEYTPKKKAGHRRKYCAPCQYPAQEEKRLAARKVNQERLAELRRQRPA